MSSNFSYKELFATFTEVEKKYAPQSLFAAGDSSMLFSGLKISVVGSRKPSKQGIQDASCIAETLVEHRAIVVSGLAEGIDTVAHETAMMNGGRTISVLGTPLNVAYPAKNAALQTRIKEEHLAISQFPEGYPTRKENFPMRNRTMALISDATIIVEASQTSGTRHQGWEALRLGRLVFIMKAVLENPALTWPKEMMQYGAQELTCDLLPQFLEVIPNITTRLAYA